MSDLQTQDAGGLPARLACVERMDKRRSPVA